MDPIKLKYIVERAAVDEQLRRAERLQRGELSAEEIEAMRTSADPEERALYELFRPLDDLEKRRILSVTNPSRTRRTWLAVAGGLCAAAACALLYAGSLRSDPARVVVTPQSAKLENGSRVLGPGGDEHTPVIDLGGCTVADLRPIERDKRLAADEKLLAFFRQGDAIIPWPASFRFNEATGSFKGTEHCMPIPVEGLSSGVSQLVIIHGRSLPSESAALRAVRSGRPPWWASWQVVRTEVVLRQPPR